MSTQAARRVTIRSDHVAGAALVAFGGAIIALSGDLPMGDLAFPGSGFLPKLVAALTIAMGATLFLRARATAPLWEIDWSDLKHAALVLLISAAAIWLYTWLGFVLAMGGLLFTLLVGIEGAHPLRALAYSVAVAGFTYGIFAYVLKTPLPLGPFGF